MMCMLLVVLQLEYPFWIGWSSPTSVEDLEMMLSNSFSSEEESLFLTSYGTCVYCNIISCLFKLLCSSWKLDTFGMVGSFVGLFLMLSCDFSVLVYDIVLTLVFPIFNWIQYTEHSCSMNVNSIICSVKYGYTQHPWLGIVVNY